MKMIFALCVLTFILIMNSTNPMTMSLLLVLMSLQAAIMSGIMNSPWLFLVISLIFLGGMMVMFLYLSTLSLSEKLITTKTSPVLIGLMVALIYSMSPWQLTNFNLSLTMIKPLSMSIVMVLVAYLTFALLLAVKFAQSFKGAISKKW